MCEIFIRASEQSYAPETRSLRLHGVATSLRLEQLFWQVLEEIAARDGMRVTQLIERLYDELVEYRGEAAKDVYKRQGQCRKAYGKGPGQASS